MQGDFCGLSSGENVSYQTGNEVSQKQGMKMYGEVEIQFHSFF